jgi:hypothetical protein
MARATLLLMVFGWMLGLPLAAHAADEARVAFLEQELRRLQQQVQALSRRIDELERPVVPAPAAEPRATAPAPASDAWVDADKWRKVHAGMSELEVIGLLGPPTSLRGKDGARVLFYALEIGTSGFLGGSVTLRDRVVVDVRPPVLR